MENFGKIAEFIKQQLATSNYVSRNELISGLLETLRKNNQEKFVMQLVYKGVIGDLIKNIEPENKRDGLKCLEIIVKADSFYTNDLTDQAILGITKLRLIESAEEAATAVNILNTIVTKVFNFTETQGICLINKHADGLLNVITRSCFNSFSLLSAIKLFNFVVEYSTNDFKLTNIRTISLTYSWIMKVLVKAEDISNLEKINTVCFTTISVANVCNGIDDELEAKLSTAFSGESKHSLHQVPTIKKDLIVSIRITVIEYVIPVAKVLEMDIESAENLVELLKTVIKLQVIKDQTLCVKLLRNGYLKYLLELSLFYPERPSFRIKVCRVISEIIETLKEYLELPISSSAEDLAAFQNYLCTGFESLPTDIGEWEDLLRIYDQKSNSLLILLFCHFIGTNEKYIFSQKSLAIRLMSVVERRTGRIIFRALWLLYSVAALDSNVSGIPSHPHLYLNAVKNLAKALQNEDKLELVYTHIEDLFLYSMKENCFPEKLRIKVISLWLGKSESENEFELFVKECLEQGYEELKIVKLLMRIVHENCIGNLTNAVSAYGTLLRFRKVIPENVVEFVWKTLSEDLESYTPSNSDILTTVLRFVSSLPPAESISVRNLRKCAMGIGKVLIRKDISLVLKTLLINAAAFAIRQSAVDNDSKVAEIFLKNSEFLQEVYDNGFYFSKIALTNICIRTLTCLIALQIKFNLKSETVEDLTFKDLETLLLNLKENKCFTIFGVELIKFVIRCEVKNTVISLRRLENDSDLLNIYNVYFLIHSVHAETLPGEEDQTYQCLATMLNYCCAQNLDMGIFLMCSATPLLMELAITGFPMCKKISYYFLDFATIWLGYLKDYRAKTKVQIKSLPEDSVKLLVQFVPFVLQLNVADNVSVENFLREISGYTQA